MNTVAWKGPGAVAAGAALSLFAMGCAQGGDAASRWTGTVRDSAGVALVTNHDTPIWREGEEWQFTRTLKIGVAEGEPEYMIGGLSGLVMLSDGRVVIGDALNHNVRFFSPEGTYLKTVGKQGKGPGEFSGSINLLLGPGDTILAIDSWTMRANVISPDGEWLSSFPTTPSYGFWIVNWDDDETTREIVSLLRPLQGEGAPSETEYDLLVLRDLQGAFGDTLARLPTDRTFTGEGESQLIHLYRGTPAYDLCDGFVVTANTSNYRFTWRGRDGAVVRVATLDREPSTLTGQDQEVFVERLDTMWEQNHVPQAQRTAIKSRLRFESSYPAFRQFRCGPEGSILVQRVLPLREMTAEQRTSFGIGTDPPGADEWDIFDREGRYLGVAPLPTPPHRHAFYRDQSGGWVMAGLDRGELDVPFAGVWRIEGITSEE